MFGYNVGAHDVFTRNESVGLAATGPNGGFSKQPDELCVIVIEFVFIAWIVNELGHNWIFRSNRYAPSTGCTGPLRNLYGSSTDALHAKWRALGVSSISRVPSEEYLQRSTVGRIRQQATSFEYISDISAKLHSRALSGYHMPLSSKASDLLPSGSITDCFLFRMSSNKFYQL